MCLYLTPLRIIGTCFSLTTKFIKINLYSYLIFINSFQVDLWKKYIAWEKSNPLRSEDTSLVTRRVMFAFEQCLLCLGHHADVWYEAAQFLDQSSKILTEKGVSKVNVTFACFV